MRVAGCDAGGGAARMSRPAVVLATRNQGKCCRDAYGAHGSSYPLGAEFGLTASRLFRSTLSAGLYAAFTYMTHAVQQIDMSATDFARSFLNRPTLDVAQGHGYARMPINLKICRKAGCARCCSVRVITDQGFYPAVVTLKFPSGLSAARRTTCRDSRAGRALS